MTTPQLVSDDLVLGSRINGNVPEADQRRQRREVEEILRRFERQPGVILADEVGMGKTFVALAIATTVALKNPAGPVIVMVPSNLVAKWQQDLKTFCELYTAGRRPVPVGVATHDELVAHDAIRFAAVKDGAAFLRLLDDPRPVRAHLIFVSHGAMSRQRMDKWVNLCLIAEALRRHARGGNHGLIQVKKVIHRFLAQLLWMTGRESRHDLGEELWQRLLRSSPADWKEIYNAGIRKDERKLVDDPVPKAVLRSLDKLDLRELAEALRHMPIRARGGVERVAERIAAVREELRKVDRRLWGEVLAKSRWRSPLLVMDEAHHLKNAETQLARQLQSPESADDLRTGEGAMSQSFDRMLFLTATPFQLGHKELVHVLERFGDVRWDPVAFGEKTAFQEALRDLNRSLDDSQRTSIALQRAWSRMRPEDLPGDAGALDDWWRRVQAKDADALTVHQRAFRDAYDAAFAARREAAAKLRPWVVRHNKGEFWPGCDVRRRQRIEGAEIESQTGHSGAGIDVPPDQLLPFFLAARAAVNPHKDLLGDALCSSYEAFRHTRADREHPEDVDNETSQHDLERKRRQEEIDSLLNDRWYLAEFDASLQAASGALHPKIAATVRRTVDLWEQGEKVVVFAFYRHTCRAIRNHISTEIERRVLARARERLGVPESEHDQRAVETRLALIQDRFFDKPGSAGHRAMDGMLESIVDRHASLLGTEDADGLRSTLITVMRRFLRVHTTLVRCFPLEKVDSADPAELVAEFLDHADASGMSWRQKFDGFVEFVLSRCSLEERTRYLEELQRISTGAHKTGEEDSAKGVALDEAEATTLANVALCSGETRSEVRTRRMRTFNTPFFPDILVCSEVMAEGVDLQRFCRHMIHHDLAWNPSTIEQRTGRIDRIGCKATNRHPILSFLPYLSGAADERQFRVMRDREQWFQVVMGQEAVADLITAETVDLASPLPKALVESLAFDLSVNP
ncbi:MAG: DEAD/DEAH box helicase [Pirellulales bacterium]